MIKDLPDPNIDWDRIRLKKSSDAIRPKKGFRYCKKCGNLYPINCFYFCRNKNTPDGYSYICKECSKH